MSGAEEKVSDSDCVVYHLRDRNPNVVAAWEKAFADYSNNVKISHGDIFKGAPAVSAIVSPANSFGFMDGGIDQVYSDYFGWQMQWRLQKVIRDEYDGELPVGQALIIPAYDPEKQAPEIKSDHNQGQAIEYLISAPTMRVPAIVKDTVNAYLAFRAVIIAVKKHNKNKELKPIDSVLIPGLATAVGRMPEKRCAFQMLQAYETFVKGKNNFRIQPDSLSDIYDDNMAMLFYK